MGETRHKKHSNKQEKLMKAEPSTDRQRTKQRLDTNVPELSREKLPSSLKWSYEYPRSCISANVEVRNLGNRGFGVVATRSIKPGELLLIEAPLVHLSPTEDADDKDMRESYIDDKVAALPKDLRKVYRNLCDTHKDGFSKNMSVFYSNCYDLKHYGTGACLGQVASRINHSCLPNVCFSFIRQLPAGVLATDNKLHLQQHGDGAFMAFHAIKAIGRGKELLANYESIWQASMSRQQAMRSYYGFECDCQACRPQDPYWEKSDRRRQRMQLLERRIEALEADYESRAKFVDPTDATSRENITNTLNDLGTLAELMLNESLVGGHDLADVYKALAKWSLRRQAAAEAIVASIESDGTDDNLANDASLSLVVARTDAVVAGKAARAWLEKELDVCRRSFGSFGERTLIVQTIEHVA